MQDKAAIKAAGEAWWPACVVFRDGEDPGFSGSGLLVSIGSDVVVATAGHVLEKLPQNSTTGIVFLAGITDDKATDLRLERGAIARMAIEILAPESGRRPDVGLALLKPGVLDRHPKARPIPLAHLKPCPSFEALAGRGMYFFGAPAKGATQVAPRNYEMVVDMFFTATKDTFAPKASGYSDEVIQLELSPPGEPSFDPHGMSGGPIFLSMMEPHELWSPYRLQVCAIAFWWTAEDNVILAEPIDSWLRLVERLRREHPDFWNEA